MCFGVIISQLSKTLSELIFYLDPSGIVQVTLRNPCAIHLNDLCFIKHTFCSATYRIIYFQSMNQACGLLDIPYLGFSHCINVVLEV